MEAIVFGDQLAAFWGEYSSLSEYESEGDPEVDACQNRQEEAEAAAIEANLAKQRGFYVDRDGAGAVVSPTQIEAGTTAAELQTAAQVVEMLLIRDHSRMKIEAVTPYDSTHAQQFRLLPISHPDDWAAASDQFRSNETSPINRRGGE
ncbi:AbiV family abortive infection protein [Rhodococcus koreensis]|nr:AbiV family abortive infection protein [Rhodococcus koreensis]